MKTKDLETLVSQLGPWNASEVNHRFRRLRAINVLPNTPGRNAPNLSAEQVASALIALCAVDRAHESVVEAMHYESLVCTKGAFKRRKVFHEALTAVVSDPEICDSVQTVRLNQSVRTATIYWNDPDNPKSEIASVYGTPKADEFPPAYTETVLGWRFLNEVMTAYHEGDDDGGFTGAK